MKKLNISRSLKSKKFKYGGYATLLTAIVIVLLIVINLVASAIPARWDLTADKKYTLSEQTLKILDRIDKDIVIYNVRESGQENPMTDYFQYDIETLLNRYKANSAHIRVDEIDPIRDPGTAQKYSTEEQNLMVGSIVVEHGDKHRVISPYDMLDVNNYNLVIEQRLTSAISFVMGEDSPVVYTLTGHHESELPTSISYAMDLENFEIKELNLAVSEGVPEDAAILIINSPKTDLLDEEVDYITEYLENEGRAFITIDPLTEELENFEKVFNSYGITVQNAFIIEGQNDRYVLGNPLYIVPEYKDHDITTPLIGGRDLFYVPFVQGIEILDTKKRSTLIEPLMVTSGKAFARPTTMEGTSIEKQDGDIEGPFNVAVAITNEDYHMVDNTSKITKLVVIGNSQFQNTKLGSATNLVLNSLNWLHERKENIAVRPKSLIITPLNINENQKRAYGTVTIVIMPLALLVSGLVMWLRRRHL